MRSLFLVATVIVALAFAAAFLPGCTASGPPEAPHAQAPAIDLRALDSPPPTAVDEAPVIVNVRATFEGEPAYPAPWVSFSQKPERERKVVFARGPCEFRHPINGKWMILPSGAEVAWTDGQVEVAIPPPDPGDES